MGPTSTNSCPARFVFIKSDEMKEKIKPALLPNNVDKCMTAPVITIIGYDLDFSDHMGKLFPHMDVAPMYKGNSDMNFATAFRNGSLQGAYLMIVARALGLDCGPMSGFNNELVDEEFFSGTNIKSNFISCGILSTASFIDSSFSISMYILFSLSEVLVLIDLEKLYTD